MSKAQTAAIAFAMHPPKHVKFIPSPHKLVRARVDRSGDERVHPEFDEELADVHFDPWRRGDLVVVKRTLRSYALKGGVTERGSWHVARRHTTPATVRQRLSLTEETSESAPWTCETPRYEHDGQLWRITLFWLDAAARLIGQTFETREALETALISRAPCEVVS